MTPKKASLSIYFSLLLAISVLSLNQRTALAASDTAPDFERIEESTIHFKKSDPSTPAKAIKTDLFDLKYLGTLKPYFFFSAKPCKSCLHDVAIYSYKASGGRPTAFVHPGKIFEPKTRALVLESRAFLGHCLTKTPGPVYVVFQKERIDRKRGMQPSVLIAEPGPDHLSEKLIEKHLPQLKDTLRWVKQKVCQEINGRNRLMLSKPLDLNLRRKMDTEDDEENIKESSEPTESK